MSKLSDAKEFLYEEYNIINPALTFDGDYVYGAFDPKETSYNPNHDILVLNSLIDDKGRNKYQELFNKKVYANFNDPKFDAYKERMFKPLLINRMDKDGKGRHIEVSNALTMFALLGNQVDLSNLTNPEEEIVDVGLEFFRSSKKELNDVIRNGNNSSYYDKYQNMYHNVYGSHEVKTFEQFLEIYSHDLSNRIYMFRCFKDQVEHPITFTDKEFRSCFDSDKFLVIYIKIILDNQYDIIKYHKDLDSSFVIAQQIISTLSDAQLDSFNPTIKVYNKGNRKIEPYNYRNAQAEFLRIYNKYISNNKDVSTSQIEYEQAKKMNLIRDNEAFNKLVNLMSREEKEIISTEFNILPKGETEKTDRVKQLGQGYSAKKKTIDDNEVLYRKYIFEETNYICQIVGKDKFNGYVGYVYENGLVIFERFYQDDGSIAQQNATYVMNYKNFIEFIQLTKPEIVEYIKSTDNPDIRRLYHTKNWADNLSKHISSIDISDESKDFAGSIALTNAIKR